MSEDLGMMTAAAAGLVSPFDMWMALDQGLQPTVTCWPIDEADPAVVKWRAQLLELRVDPQMDTFYVAREKTVVEGLEKEMAKLDAHLSAVETHPWFETTPPPGTENKPVPRSMGSRALMFKAMEEGKPQRTCGKRGCHFILRSHYCNGKAEGKTQMWCSHHRGGFERARHKRVKSDE